MNAARHNYLFLLVVSLVLSVAASDPPTQQTSPQKRVTAKDSIVVGAHLTPEEVEDGKINDAYQPLYHLTRPAD